MQGPPRYELRELQKKLATEITTFVHGREEFERAIATTEKLFADQTAPVTSLSMQDLETMEGVVKFDYGLDKIRSGKDITSFLAETGIFTSKGEARKMIQNGGVSINRNKIDDAAMLLEEGLLLHSQYLLVQKGKKNYYLVKAI